MSAEDLEIHQLSDADEGKWLMEKGGEGIFCGGSPHTLINAAPHSKGEEDDDVSTEEDVCVDHHNEQKNSFIKVNMEHN